MRGNDFNENYSLVLAACSIFALSYISFEEKNKYKKSFGNLLSMHIVSNNENHIYQFTKYLLSNTDAKIPFKSEIFHSLLIAAKESRVNVSRAISCIIKCNPKLISEIFWTYSMQNEMSSEQFDLISEVISCDDSLLPPNEVNQRNNIIRFTNDLSNPSNSFAEVEKALTVCKWLVKNRLFTPDNDNFLLYDNPNLNSMLLDCWAEFLNYCDFSKLKKLSFPKPDDINIRKSLLNIFCKAVLNPKFSFGQFYVPHWICDAITKDFGNKQLFLNKDIFNNNCTNDNNINSTNDINVFNWSGKNKIFDNYSLFNLSIDELNSCASICHLLPDRLFVQILRANLKQNETCKCYINIISLIPIHILDLYIVEFFGFVEKCLKFDRYNDSLGEMIRKLIVPLCPHLNSLIVHMMKSIDFYNVENLINHLTLLNIIFRFPTDAVYFLDVVDNIFESLEFNQFSLKFYIKFMEFLSLVSFGLTEISDKLLAFASASLFAIFPLFKIPQEINSYTESKTIYDDCVFFYKNAVFDIMSDRCFKMVNSFPITNYALQLIRNVKSININIVNSLLRIFPGLIYLTPIESISTINYLIPKLPLVDPKNRQHIQKICDAVTQQLGRSSDAVFIMLTSLFFQIISDANVQFPDKTSATSNIESFDKDFDRTRIALKLNNSLIPVLLSKKDMYFLFIENNSPSIDSRVLNAIYQEIINMNVNEWKHIRCAREILYFFKFKQPMNINIRYFSWINEHFYQKKCAIKKELADPNEFESSESLINNFSLFYPIDKSLTNIIDIIYFMVKNYTKSNDNVCHRYVCLLITKNFDACLTKYINSFKFLCFLSKSAIPFGFTVTVGNVKCVALGFRLLNSLNCEPRGEIGEDWLLFEQMRCFIRTGRKLDYFSLTLSALLHDSQINIQSTDKLIKSLNMQVTSITILSLSLITSFLTENFQSAEILNFMNLIYDSIVVVLSSIDIGNPFVFEATVLFVNAMTNPDIDFSSHRKKNIINAFFSMLDNLESDVLSAPILHSITQFQILFNRAERKNKINFLETLEKVCPLDGFVHRKFKTLNNYNY